jgi:aspartyl aminopeptidase
VDAAGHARAAALAASYAAFLGAGKTPRRAVSGLLALAAEQARAIDAAPTATAGELLTWVGPGGDAVALIRVGRRPVTDGMRIVVAGIDAPRIDLKQSPIYDRANLAMLDTAVYGQIDAKSWLATPLALYLYASRRGAASGDVDLAIGDAEGEPVLAIADLLPHLSGKAQAQQVVDSLERLDAIGAGSRAGLSAFLDAHGLDAASLSDAEVSLVPAGPAVPVGVDGALIAGYGHRHRGLAWAAVRALVDEPTPENTSVVIAVSKLAIGGTGSSGLAFVQTAASLVLERLGAEGDAIDALGTRRAYARSSLLVSVPLDGKQNEGVILSARADDALPDSTRRAIDRFTEGGAQLQIVFDVAGHDASRQLSSLDLDAVGVALPTTGNGGPIELLSALDLYSGYLACRAWFARR